MTAYLGSQQQPTLNRNSVRPSAMARNSTRTESSMLGSDWVKLPSFAPMRPAAWPCKMSSLNTMVLSRLRCPCSPDQYRMFKSLFITLPAWMLVVINVGTNLHRKPTVIIVEVVAKLPLGIYYNRLYRQTFLLHSRPWQPSDTACWGLSQGVAGGGILISTERRRQLSSHPNTVLRPLPGGDKYAPNTPTSLPLPLPPCSWL